MNILTCKTIDDSLSKAALDKEYEELENDDGAMRTGSKASFNDDSDTDDEGSKPSRGSGVAYEEFTVLSRRVDRMEHSIGSIVSKIDAVLVKLNAMEKEKMKRKETIGKALDNITEVSVLHILRIFYSEEI